MVDSAVNSGDRLPAASLGLAVMEGSPADPSQGSTLGLQEDPLQMQMKDEGSVEATYGPSPNRGASASGHQPGSGIGAVDVTQGGPETVPPVLSAASNTMPNMSPLPFSTRFGCSPSPGCVPPVLPHPCPQVHGPCGFYPGPVASGGGFQEWLMMNMLMMMKGHSKGASSDLSSWYLPPSSDRKKPKESRKKKGQKEDEDEEPEGSDKEQGGRRPQKEAADPIPRSLRRALIRTHRRDRIFCQHLRGEKPEKGKSPRGKTEEQPRLSKDRGVLWRQEQVSEVEACSPGAAATLQAGGGRVGNVDILVNEEGCKGLPGTTHCE